jgi:membrane-associated phospholipid phosphatase
VAVRGDDRASAPEAARWSVVCLSSLAAFCVLSVAAAVGPLPGDVALREAILSLVSSDATWVFGWINHGGTWRVLLPATLVLLALSGEARRRWWLWCAVLIVTPVVEDGWKHVVARSRPGEAAFGFPSGHTAAVSAFTVAIIYLMGRERLVPAGRSTIEGAVLAGAFLVGLSRVVLRAHWPSDVLGGAALGATCVAAAAWWDAAHPLAGAHARGRSRRASTGARPA